MKPTCRRAIGCYFSGACLKLKWRHPERCVLLNKMKHSRSMSECQMSRFSSGCLARRKHLKLVLFFVSGPCVKSALSTRMLGMCQMAMSCQIPQWGSQSPSFPAELWPFFLFPLTDFQSPQEVKVICCSTEMAVGQSQWYHFGVGAPPILVYCSTGIGMFTGAENMLNGHVGCPQFLGFEFCKEVVLSKGEELGLCTRSERTNAMPALGLKLRCSAGLGNVAGPARLAASCSILFQFREEAAYGSVFLRVLFCRIATGWIAFRCPQQPPLSLRSPLLGCPHKTLRGPRPYMIGICPLLIEHIYIYIYIYICAEPGRTLNIYIYIRYMYIRPPRRASAGCFDRVLRLSAPSARFMAAGSWITGGLCHSARE